MYKENTKDAISDNEIRILGGEPHQNNTKTRGRAVRPFRRYWLVLLAGVIVLVFAVVLSIRFSKTGGDSSQEKVVPNDTVCVTSAISVVGSTVSVPFLHICDTVVNDIPMQILIPNGCEPELHMGQLPTDTNILLCVRAADIRKDKMVPAGAFVYKGEVISKGHSKYGFCAIVHGQVTIGRQLETNLFERAVEENGSFFRQYSLVSNGQFMNIPPKGKSIRRALCLRDGKLQVITTYDRESFHDFTQALIDIGVQEALALVGGEALLQYRTPAGEFVTQGVDKSLDEKYSKTNYLVWRK